MSAPLTGLQIQFLQRLLGESVLDSAVSHAAEYFQQHHHLGQRIRRRYVYTTADHELAANILSSLGIPHAPLPSGTLRSQLSGTQPEKRAGTRAPHADSVAIKPASGRCQIDGRSLCLAPDSYMVVTSEQALAISAGRLLLVENLETFRRLEHYRWIDYQGQDVLAIFLGDNRFNQADALAVVAERSEPCWSLYDFDPNGLGRAVQLPRLERAVFPDLTALELLTLRMDRKDLFSDSVNRWQRTIEEDSRPMIAQLWALMRRLRRGLPQEQMETMMAAPAAEKPS